MVIWNRYLHAIILRIFKYSLNLNTLITLNNLKYSQILLSKLQDEKQEEIYIRLHWQDANIGSFKINEPLTISEYQIN